MARLVVFLLALVFVFGFAALTAGVIASQGLTPLGLVSIVIVAVLGFGILGALLRLPRR